MKCRAIAWLIVAAALGCARAAPLVAKPAPPDDRTALREQVRDIARPHCGSCHQSTLPTAKAAALAVFDLDRKDWSAPMNPKQLRSFLGRLDGKLTEGTRPPVRALLAAELAARGG